MAGEISRRWGVWAALVLVAIVLVVALILAAKHPVALIRVVDATGQPVAGAIVVPEGLRSKPGQYRSGWYGWRPAFHGVTNAPVLTDSKGYAQVPYPQYVFERIETGALSLSVDHPGFVPSRPECLVANAPPAGAPWNIWLDYWHDRIVHGTLVARPSPVVLEQGAILRISTSPDEPLTADRSRLLAQASGHESGGTNFWIWTEPGAVMTRRLAPGSHLVRAVQFDDQGDGWFSLVLPITAVAGQTNDLTVTLKHGVTVRGRLDETVPRPVSRGRVVAHIWPTGVQAKESPPAWHAWAGVDPEGWFVLNSLPEGDLEILALCHGYVSTNGPGQFPNQMRYPQLYVLGPEDLDLVVGMEPTARLEVTVTDKEGQPLKDAKVATWPNARYGEWSAVILMTDCYNTADRLQLNDPHWFWKPMEVADFVGVSGADGIAVLPNVPANVTTLAIDHPRYALPAVADPTGAKHRQASFVLVAGQTNRLSLQLEPRAQLPISHY